MNWMMGAQTGRRLAAQGLAARGLAVRGVALRSVGAARRRGPVSRGQALVETALLFTILMLLVAGATDVSTLLTDHLNIVYAARQGARIGSTLGASSAADCGVIGAVQAALAGDAAVSLTQIIIYKSDANGLASAGFEEVYVGSTQCDISTGAPTNAPSVNTWPASMRNNTAFLEDSLGVELDYRYTFQLNLLGGGSFLSSDHAVVPIEPTLNPTPTSAG